MSKYFQELLPEEKELLQQAPFPEWYPVMLATLTERRFSDSAWIYEPKFDGERAVAYFQAGKIRLLSRNQQNLNRSYPDLLEVLQSQDARTFVVDGEIVAFEEKVPSFSKLQQRIGLRKISPQKIHEVPVYYYLFDILYLEGFDLRKLPLKARQHLLEKAIQYKGNLCLTKGVTKNGLEFYMEACQLGWEGVIAKCLESSYKGKRSGDWLKFKCQKSQELIIIGYTLPEGQRKEFGALLVGYYDKGNLKYAGRVGTGFTNRTLTSLNRKWINTFLLNHPSVKLEIPSKT
jgi:DNA ligase D-like protein (predicted ligase)